MALLNSEMLEETLATLPGWEHDADKNALHKRYRFKDYVSAFAFVAKISLLAERQNHHPDISFGWGYVDIWLTTHDAGGVTQNDVTLALAIEKNAG
jgi:4a-hydroxytetrahydrobiopterin dehydratase